MNNAEAAAIQEVRSDGGAGSHHVPVTPPGGSRYWWRLVKASALVAAGIAVNLWVDSPRRAIQHHTLTVDGGAAPNSRPVSQDTRNASDEALLIEAVQEDVFTTDAGVEAPRPAATSGRRSVGATDAAAELSDPSPAGVSQLRSAASPPSARVLRTGGVPHLPQAEPPMVPSVRRLAGWAGDVAERSPTAVPELTAAVARSRVTVEALPAVTPANGSVRTMAAASAPREEESILQVLREYETALERNDPLAAKAVWPALDDRALARAFNDLQSQSLALEGCGVTLANSNAVARAKCQGVATYLPKVGRRKPISASHEWTFTLAKAGGDWQIESAAIR